MKRYISLIIMLLFALNAKAQLEVQKDSFKETAGFVIIDHDKTDVNNIPFAVIKVRTQNIDDKQRHELTFGSSMNVDIDLAYKTGEVWVYLTYQAEYLKISHPDFSSTEFWLPFDMEGGHGYEMTLVNNSTIGAAVVAPVKTLYNYLIIKSDQPNAMIYIDDAFVGTGSVSKSFVVGEKHRWKIECNLYHSESGEAVVLENEKVKIEKTLRPAFGYINVTSAPESGASVLVDGNLLGVTPFKTDRIASGQHSVRVMKEMYDAAEQMFTVTDGNTTEAKLTMTANFVKVTVTTDSGSDIYIDNERVGKGSWNGRLSDGNHTFEARKASHKNSFKNVALTLGRDETIIIPNPEPIYGTLDINSDPMEAVIYIDGVRKGETPAVLYDVLIGKHELRLEKTGCAPITKTITLDEENLLAVNEKLPTGREVSISTDRSGDQLYADGSYIGVSPMTATLSFGEHTIKALRDSNDNKAPKTVQKTISVAQGSGAVEVKLAFSDNKTFTVNGVTFEMVAVKGGTFTMGATSEQGGDAYDSEKPAHSVTLSDYYIGKFEVTQELWQAVMGSNPSYFKGSKNPVEQVSWNDC